MKKVGLVVIIGVAAFLIVAALLRSPGAHEARTLPSPVVTRASDARKAARGAGRAPLRTLAALRQCAGVATNATNSPVPVSRA